MYSLMTKDSDKGDAVTVEGNCHCNAIKFKCTVPKVVSVYRCNCTICEMKQNHLFVSQKKDFQWLSGQDKVTTYQFGEKIAIHMFCRVCGVQAFYQPRSNPDCYGVTIYCVRDYDEVFEKVEWKDFDGKNWEDTIKTSDITKWSGDGAAK